MIKSMTGFAALTREDELAAISVTLRAVNHRYLDLQLRVPAVARRSGAAHSRAGAAGGRARTDRGEREHAARRPALPEVELNEPFVAALEQTLERARARGIVGGQLTPGDLCGCRTR